MAIPVTCSWEVRTTGNDANGGGFCDGSNTDYSQQDSPQLALTDVVAAGTTTLTSVTGGFTSAMVDNLIAVSGGSGSLARTRRRITAVGSSNSITVDASVTTGTGITGKVGGALRNPGEATAIGMVAGNRVHLKAGGTSSDYSITTDDVTSGGACIPLMPSGGDVGVSQMIGYHSARYDDPTGSNRPTIKVNVSLSNPSRNWPTQSFWGNIKIDIDSNGRLFYQCSSGYVTAYRIGIYNSSFSPSGLDVGESGANQECIECDSDQGVFATFCFKCDAPIVGAFYIVDSVAPLFTGAEGSGSQFGTRFLGFTTSYGGTGSAYDAHDNTRGAFIYGSYAEALSAYGFNVSRNVVVKDSVGYNNTSGNFLVSYNSNQASGYRVGYTTSPTSSALVNTTTNWGLNATVGGGAGLRAASTLTYSGPRFSTLSYSDIGGVQHQDSGGGAAGMLYVPNLEGT